MPNFSQSPCSRMQESPRGSIYPTTDSRLPYSLQPIEEEPFRYIFKPQDTWPQEHGRADPSPPRKDSDLVKSGTSPEEIKKRFRHTVCRDCPNCHGLLNINYGLVFTIFFVILYLSAHHLNVFYKELLHESRTPDRTDIYSLSLSSHELEKRAVSSRASIILPAYFGPEDTASWSKVFAQISKYQDVIEFIVVINPSNGPGSKEEIARYSSTIQRLSKYRNINIIGYIHQSWGARDITTDIDTWLSYFPNQLDGFFLDEMPSVDSGSNLNTVSNNNGYVKKKAKGNFRQNKQGIAVQNPGTEVDKDFYSLPYNADVTIVLENTVNYLPVWANSNRASLNTDKMELGLILLDVSDGALDTTVKSMLKYAKYVFATNLGATNAYESIASDWDQFVSYVSQYSGMSTKGSKTTTTKAMATSGRRVNTKTTSARVGNTRSKGRSTQVRVSRTTNRRFPTPTNRKANKIITTKL
ncbi:hypothetical protein H072_6582 [Dactylellina haptotyla CBS 200.50]|uniref:Spherulin 4-like cell surface protein n=1 Tax=Dactylellina haptotyla (strain CBS 200.50) TaxID=1284197 RepID=S8AER3_DACHA|nr:hypothetical protein H072_6582 [Dactylellina haptotyla CBS 200.50]